MRQHADADPALQQKMLKRLKPSHLPDGIDYKAYSLLVDRVRINLKKPQLYGSQFHRVDNTWVPYPIDHPADVDQRRQALGLMPLRLYACVVVAANTYNGN
ncbi:DUF6624 domain-containing protein [Xanthomonas sp. MUS 060]|uniref:DUF6624 domain-containing protein n=1 Tax=Xanthomonas sp. MUS 060 TaxID=1588031 RepID=UPI0005F292D5|nr:DUF6624 domain-containing protein [Xanthomonas sp. MUS 060]